MPASEWVDLGGRFKGAGPVSFTISGTDAMGGPVSTSAPIQIWYSPEAVLGSLYYWSQTASGIKRATFGSKKAVLYIQPESPTNQFKCAGCHSVSRNGQVIAFAVQQTRDHDGMGIQTAPADDAAKPFVKPTLGTSPAGVGYPRTAGQLEAQDHFGNNVALSPDGSIAAVNGAAFGSPPGEEYFELRDTKTGAPLMSPATAAGPAKAAQWIIGDPLFGANQLPILPEWAPDGKSLVAALDESRQRLRVDLLQLPKQNRDSSLRRQRHRRSGGARADRLRPVDVSLLPELVARRAIRCLRLGFRSWGQCEGRIIFGQPQRGLAHGAFARWTARLPRTDVLRAHARDAVHGRRRSRQARQRLHLAEVHTFRSG